MRHSIHSFPLFAPASQVSELRNRFDPAARERGVGGRAVPRPADMGNPRNTVSEITRIFEHKARSDRRKVRHRLMFSLEACLKERGSGQLLRGLIIMHKCFFRGGDSLLVACF